MMSIEADSIKAQVVSEVMQRIVALDQEQRYEDSYALTQEFREWLLEPPIQPSSRQARP